MLGLGGLGLWGSIKQIAQGHAMWLPALATLLVTVVGLYGAVRLLRMLAKRARLVTFEEGFEVQFADRTRSWRWSEVSGFRRWIGPHGSVVGVAFDRQAPGSAKTVVTLPAGWPFGVDGMVAFLVAAKANFTQERMGS